MAHPIPHPATMRSRVLRDVATRAEPVGAGGRRLRFVGATDAVARDGGILTLDGWDVDAWRENPVMLYGHDHAGLPIARGTAVERTERGLEFEFDFADRDTYPFADLVYRLYKAGFMRAVSVGFRVRKDRPPTDDERARGAQWVSTDHELLEVSAVPVGADPNAVTVTRTVLRPDDAPMLRGMGVEPFTALAQEAEAMTTRTIEVRDNDGTLVATLRDADEFDAEHGFHDITLDAGDDRTVVAVIGRLLEDGELAIQGIRFEDGFDHDTATAWVRDNEGDLAAWREPMPEDDEEEEDAPEDAPPPPPPSDDDDDEEEDREADDTEDEDEDAPERLAAVVARLEALADRIEERLAEGGGSDDDDDGDDEDARSASAVASSGVVADDDPYDILGKARAFAGDPD